MKFISWNIDSLNAALTGDSERSGQSRDVLNRIADAQPDFIAIQETKLPATGPSAAHTEALAAFFPGYESAWVSSRPPAKKGYAGTMSLWRKGQEVKADSPAIGAPDTMDSEGRILTLETPGFFFVNVYTPNSGDGLVRLADRQQWDACFTDYLKKLDASKPVIACGDFNAAHEEIDLANPDSNHFSAGFTDEERQGFTNLLAAGFTDSFRLIHGQEAGAYSWWSQRVKTSKLNNAGWRIDYFLVSSRLNPAVKVSAMMDSGDRRDHTPIILELEGV